MLVQVRCTLLICCYRFRYILVCIFYYLCGLLFCCLYFFFFFFSSRRRHTRCGRDWSSDVCSSDLLMPVSSQLAGVRLAVITVSDRSARGERADLTGPVLADALRGHGADVHAQTIDRKSVV